MSELKVNKISPRSGTDVTLGDSGDTFTIPAGATLTNNGTASGFASIAWQSAIKTTSFTAVAGEGYWVNTTSGAITITLPASASVGDRIILTDYARTWGTNNLTINQNSLNFQGFTSPNPVYNTNGQSIDLVYSGATNGWIPNSDDDVAFKNPPYDAEYLLIAGGGGGAYGNGGGGGAGGFLTNFGGTAISLTAGATYTITVGGGGAGAGVTPNPGSKGGDSVLSGTGISTVTAEGGGFGAAGPAGGETGGAGGSGGGGAYGGAPAGPGPGGAATAGQGNAGGAGQPSLPGTPGAYAGGGGGGAGAAGSNGTPSAGGDGGNGLSNSITGSAVTYAGGGGGAVDPAHPGGDGGTGGGGDGAEYSAPGRDATPGTDG